MSSVPKLHTILSSSQIRSLLGAPSQFSRMIGLHRRRIHYLNADVETFKKVALNAESKDKVVLVDFYAGWCPPCKIISPILERLTSGEDVKTGSSRSLDLVTINTDEQVELASEYRIRSLPTVMAFRDGKPVDHFIGALNESGIRQFLQRV